MADRSSGDAAKQALKNPLLCATVTGLSIDDFLQNAVLVPVLQPVQSSLLNDNIATVTLIPVSRSDARVDATEDPTRASVSPLPGDTMETRNLPPFAQNDNRAAPVRELTDVDLSSQDDEFDFESYYARLHALPDLSEKLDKNSNPAEEATFSDVDLDTNLSSDLHEDDDSISGRGLTADLAQNLSQLPQVLPHVASAVFSSFSSILNRSMNPWQDAAQNYAAPSLDSVQTYSMSSDSYRTGMVSTAMEPIEDAVSVAPVPMIDTSGLGRGGNASSGNAPVFPPTGGERALRNVPDKEIQYPRKLSREEAKEKGSNLFRMATRKKTYAHVPGLRLGETENSLEKIQHLQMVPGFPPILPDIPRLENPSSQEMHIHQNKLHSVQAQNLATQTVSLEKNDFGIQVVTSNYSFVVTGGASLPTNKFNSQTISDLIAQPLTPISSSFTSRISPSLDTNVYCDTPTFNNLGSPQNIHLQAMHTSLYNNKNRLDSVHSASQELSTVYATQISPDGRPASDGPSSQVPLPPPQVLDFPTDRLSSNPYSLARSKPRYAPAISSGIPIFIPPSAQPYLPYEASSTAGNSNPPAAKSTPNMSPEPYFPYIPAANYYSTSSNQSLSFPTVDNNISINTQSTVPIGGTLVFFPSQQNFESENKINQKALPTSWSATTPEHSATNDNHQKPYSFFSSIEGNEGVLLPSLNVAESSVIFNPIMNQAIENASSQTSGEPILENTVIDTSSISQSFDNSSFEPSTLPASSNAEVECSTSIVASVHSASDNIIQEGISILPITSIEKNTSPHYEKPENRISSLPVSASATFQLLPTSSVFTTPKSTPRMIFNPFSLRKNQPCNKDAMPGENQSNLMSEREPTSTLFNLFAHGPETPMPAGSTIVDSSNRAESETEVASVPLINVAEGLNIGKGTVPSFSSMASSSSTNQFRMSSHKRPQYYSGPIDGTPQPSKVIPVGRIAPFRTVNVPSNVPEYFPSPRQLNRSEAPYGGLSINDLNLALSRGNLQGLRQFQHGVSSFINQNLDGNIAPTTFTENPYFPPHGEAVPPVNTVTPHSDQIDTASLPENNLSEEFLNNDLAEPFHIFRDNDSIIQNEIQEEHQYIQGSETLAATVQFSADSYILARDSMGVLSENFDNTLSSHDDVPQEGSKANLENQSFTSGISSTEQSFLNSNAGYSNDFNTSNSCWEKSTDRNHLLGNNTGETHLESENPLTDENKVDVVPVPLINETLSSNPSHESKTSNSLFLNTNLVDPLQVFTNDNAADVVTQNNSLDVAPLFPEASSFFDEPPELQVPENKPHLYFGSMTSYNIYDHKFGCNDDTTSLDADNIAGQQSRKNSNSQVEDAKTDSDSNSMTNNMDSSSLCTLQSDYPSQPPSNMENFPTSLDSPSTPSCKFDEKTSITVEQDAENVDSIVTSFHGGCPSNSSETPSLVEEMQSYNLSTNNIKREEFADGYGSTIKLSIADEQSIVNISKETSTGCFLKDESLFIPKSEISEVTVENVTHSLQQINLKELDLQKYDISQPIEPFVIEPDALDSDDSEPDYVKAINNYDLELESKISAGDSKVAEVSLFPRYVNFEAEPSVSTADSAINPKQLTHHDPLLQRNDHHLSAFVPVRTRKNCHQDFNVNDSNPSNPTEPNQVSICLPQAESSLYAEAISSSYVGPTTQLFYNFSGESPWIMNGSEQALHNTDPFGIPLAYVPQQVAYVGNTPITLGQIYSSSYISSLTEGQQTMPVSNTEENILNISQSALSVDNSLRNNQMIFVGSGGPLLSVPITQANFAYIQDATVPRNPMSATFFVNTVGNLQECPVQSPPMATYFETGNYAVENYLTRNAASNLSLAYGVPNLSSNEALSEEILPEQKDVGTITDFVEDNEEGELDELEDLVSDIVDDNIINTVETHEIATSPLFSQDSVQLDDLTNDSLEERPDLIEEIQSQFIDHGQSSSAEELIPYSKIFAQENDPFKNVPTSREIISIKQESFENSQHVLPIGFERQILQGTEESTSLKEVKTEDDNTSKLDAPETQMQLSTPECASAAIAQNDSIPIDQQRDQAVPFFNPFRFGLVQKQPDFLSGFPASEIEGNCIISNPIFSPVTQETRVTNSEGSKQHQTDDSVGFTPDVAQAPSLSHFFMEQPISQTPIASSPFQLVQQVSAPANPQLNILPSLRFYVDDAQVKIPQKAPKNMPLLPKLPSLYPASSVQVMQPGINTPVVMLNPQSQMMQSISTGMQSAHVQLQPVKAPRPPPYAVQPLTQQPLLCNIAPHTQTETIQPTNPYSGAIHSASPFRRPLRARSPYFVASGHSRPVQVSPTPYSLYPLPPAHITSVPSTLPTHPNFEPVSPIDPKVNKFFR